jgi:hypothetical protein
LLTVRLLQELVKKSAELDRGNLDYALSENPEILKLVGLTGTEEDLCDMFFQIVGANVKQYMMIQSYVHGRRTVQSNSTEEDKIAEFLVNKAFRFCAASQRDAAVAPAWKDGTDNLVNLKSFMSQHKESQGAAQFYARFDITRKCNALRMFTEKIYMVEKKRFTLTGSLFGDGGVGLGILVAAYAVAYKSGYVTSGSSYAQPAELGLQLFGQLKDKVVSFFPTASV